MPGLVIERLTQDQEAAHKILCSAIRRAVEDKRSVPCLSDPGLWDTVDRLVEFPCTGCVVFDLCAKYAETGAVTHGVLANRAMPAKRQPQREVVFRLPGGPTGVAA